VDNHRYNFEHTPPVPSSLDPSAFSSMERVYSAKSYHRLPVKVVKAEWGRPTDRCLFRAKSRWLGHAVQRNQMLQLRLSFPAHCHASFISCFTSSHVEIPRACAGPNDRRATSFDLILCVHSALSTPRHLRPCHTFFPIPFDTLNICTNLASHPAILCSRLFSCRTSCLTVYCLLRTPFRLFPCLTTFSVLFLHTISLIHRHLALPTGHF